MKTKWTMRLATLIAISVLYSCSGNPEPVVIESGEQEVESASDIIRISKAQFSSFEMELGTLSNRDFPDVVVANGILEVPPAEKASVSAYFEGYVKRINLIPGQHVKVGQVLFTLENPSYIHIQQEFLEIKEQISYLKSDYERQKVLAAEQISSQKKFLKAESDYKVAIAKLASLKKQLTLMNINAEKLSPAHLQSTISVSSPISGQVTEVNISRGMFLNPSDIAIKLINPNHMHAELQIFERNLPAIKSGQAISFRLQDQLGIEYRGVVHEVSRFIHPKKRTATVHGHLLKEQDISSLAPGMYLEAQIFTKNASGAALPAESILNIEEKHFVLVKQDRNQEGLILVRREVELGKTDNGMVEILNSSDFGKLDTVLTKGAFQLLGD